MKSFDALVVGRNCLDYLAVIPKYPEENRKTHIHTKLKEGGGQAGTSACCIAKLGGSAVLIGKLGSDREGQFCLNRLNRMNVNTAYVEIVKGGHTPTAHIYITQSSGERTIFYENNQLPPINPEIHLKRLSHQAHTILMDPETTYLAKWFHQHPPTAAKVIYDCERWRDNMTDMMAVADFFIPSETFLDDSVLGLKNCSLEGKLRTLKQHLHGELIVTLGAKGAAYLHGDKFYHVPALQVEVVDTTGAGDNFHGAFALAISRSIEIHQAVRFAVAVASLSCQGYGGRSGLPTWEQAITASQTLLE